MSIFTAPIDKNAVFPYFKIVFSTQSKLSSFPLESNKILNRLLESIGNSLFLFYFRDIFTHISLYGKPVPSCIYLFSFLLRLSTFQCYFNLLGKQTVENLKFKEIFFFNISISKGLIPVTFYTSINSVILCGKERDRFFFFSRLHMVIIDVIFVWEVAIIIFLCR